MKRIFPNVYSKVLKGKKSKCHHLVPRVCLCWHHTCAHIHFPQGSVRVSSLPELSKLSSLRFPEPGSLAPRRHRLAAPPLSSPCTPHLTSPSPGNHGPTTIPASHTPSTTSHIALSPYPPQSPQKPHLQTGVSSSCDVTSHCARAPQTPPGMSTVVTGATATQPGHGDTHNTATGHSKRMGTQCRFPSCYFIHFAAKIAEVSQLADKT